MKLFVVSELRVDGENQQPSLRWAINTHTLRPFRVKASCESESKWSEREGFYCGGALVPVDVLSRKLLTLWRFLLLSFWSWHHFLSTCCFLFNCPPPVSVTSLVGHGGGAFIPIHLLPSGQTGALLSVTHISSPPPLSSPPAMTIKILGPRPQPEQVRHLRQVNFTSLQT